MTLPGSKGACDHGQGSKKTAAKKVAGVLKTASAEPAELKNFYQRDGDFAFVRFWWVGEGPREGIAPFVHKKLWPGDRPDFGRAAKAEALLPPMVPSDYADVEFNTMALASSATGSCWWG